MLTPVEEVPRHLEETGRFECHQHRSVGLEVDSLIGMESVGQDVASHLLIELQQTSYR